MAKLTKERVKKFWDDNKGIIIGIGLTGVGLIGCAVGLKSISNKSGGASSDIENIKLWEQFMADLDDQRVNAKQYVPMSGEEFKAMNNGCDILVCNAENPELLQVTGGLIFGNKIEK